jgi:hypothetical protein
VPRDPGGLLITLICGRGLGFHCYFSKTLFVKKQSLFLIVGRMTDTRNFTMNFHGEETLQNLPGEPTIAMIDLQEDVFNALSSDEDTQQCKSATIVSMYFQAAVTDASGRPLPFTLCVTRGKEGGITGFAEPVKKGVCEYVMDSSDQGILTFQAESMAMRIGKGEPLFLCFHTPRGPFEVHLSLNLSVRPVIVLQNKSDDGSLTSCEKFAPVIGHGKSRSRKTSTSKSSSTGKKVATKKKQSVKKKKQKKTGAKKIKGNKQKKKTSTKGALRSILKKKLAAKSGKKVKY